MLSRQVGEVPASRATHYLFGGVEPNMSIPFQHARQFLEKLDFEGLFVEALGWAHDPDRPFSLELGGQTYPLRRVAELGGIRVLVCETPLGQDMPPIHVRNKIERGVSKLTSEYILIFTDATRNQSIWRWFKRATAERVREHAYQRGQSGDALLQKLVGIAFHLEELDEDGRASMAEVSQPGGKAFDVECTIKRFYNEFKGERTEFLQFVRGIDSIGDRVEYTSVVLHRLMFLYFIQKKGFLDDDPDYLCHHLEASRQRAPDQFYRSFLVPLFFEGLAREEQERSREMRRLLGSIPYLNGGLFLQHSLEIRHGANLDVPDAAFTRLFAFFDRYTWHLDERPLRADNEINLNVLGYTLEKYINQKEQGAYYTKEDITGYICRNTILPFLLDKLGNLRYHAIHPLPLTDIAPYIYPALKQANCLPTETEREFAARHKRLAAIRAAFTAGKIVQVNDLITYNLDIERFVQDWLRDLRDPVTLRAFYFQCLTRLTMLDPCVGSGAFLFAAMSVLQPLYEICLDKMAELSRPTYYDFAAELKRAAAHPNRSYYAVKSIIVNNLYGVDITDESVEICKLRLFLKLVAQVDDVHKLEALPDIDFNVRAGNTLVGYASRDEIEQAAQSSLFSLELPQRIREVDVALRAFRKLQTRVGVPARELAQAKAETQDKLSQVEDALNESLRADYGARSLPAFVANHRPFHWYVEFNRIMQDGGFDVVVGNPPYARLRSTDQYRKAGYKTHDTKNLYPIIVEKGSRLVSHTGRQGYIVPISSVTTAGYASLQQVIRRHSLHYSSFDDQPSKLFDGRDKNKLSVLLMSQASGSGALASTRLHRWNANERQCLFQRIQYTTPPQLGFANSMPKISSPVETSILGEIWKHPQLKSFMCKDSQFLVYYSLKISSFLQVLDFIPSVTTSDGRTRLPSGFKTITFKSGKLATIALCALNSTLFRWFLDVYSDGSHVNRREVLGFPIDLEACAALLGVHWESLAGRLMQKLRDTAELHTLRYQHDQLSVQGIVPRHAKAIIDEIDCVLAQHYGFTDEELDFLIHYDLKYRMGKAGTESSSDEIAD